MKNLILALVGVCIAWPVEAWAFMVAAGIVRSEWLTSVPPLDFGSSLLVIAGLSLFMTVYMFVKSLGEEAT